MNRLFCAGERRRLTLTSSQILLGLVFEPTGAMAETNRGVTVAHVRRRHSGIFVTRCAYVHAARHGGVIAVIARLANLDILAWLGIVGKPLCKCVARKYIWQCRRFRRFFLALFAILKPIQLPEWSIFIGNKNNYCSIMIISRIKFMKITYLSIFSCAVVRWISILLILPQLIVLLEIWTPALPVSCLPAVCLRTRLEFRS